jgi:hypothetical protein
MAAPSAFGSERIFLPAACAALYALLPLEREFSDSHSLTYGLLARADPYYNIAYLPLGQLLYALLMPLGASAAQTLTFLSAIGMATTVAGTQAWLARLGIPRGPALWACAAVGLAPAALFFGGVVEVHAPQAAFAAWGLYLAERARNLPRRRALMVIVAAGALALVGHLSHLLLLPGLWWLARGPSGAPGVLGVRGLPLDARWLGAGAVGVGLLLALAWFMQTPAGEPLWVPGLVWVGMLGNFAGQWLATLRQHGLFGPGDVGFYMWQEWARPAGLLAAAPAAALTAWAVGRFESVPPAARLVAGRAALASVPAILILPQTGVLERGGYYISYLPVMALLTATAVLAFAPRRDPNVLRSPRANGLVLLALAAQFSLALRDRHNFRAHEPPPFEWLDFVQQHVGPEDTLFVDSLAKYFQAASHGRLPGVMDLRRGLDLVPARNRRRGMGNTLASALSRHLEHGNLFFDAALLDGPPRRVWQTELKLLLADKRLSTERLEGSDPRYALIRVQVNP